MDSASTLPGRARQPVRVRCLDYDVVDEAAGHRHVVAVETAERDGRSFRWTIVQAIAAMREGERFVMGGGDAGQAPALEPAVCPHCPQVTLAAGPEESGTAVGRCS